MAENADEISERQSDGERTNALISITRTDKERLSAVAREHGISLSAFLRLAADEYIKNHEW